VIEHSGTLRSGHYIAYVKQSINDDDASTKAYSKPIDYLLANLFKPLTDEQCQTINNTTETIDPSSPPPSWYHISDNTIHKVPETKVLDADAYVLFYRRI
jgi:ubiquitin carboxyl-terminal hydrolase 16/45